MATLNEQAYLNLRQALICGRLTPGRVVSLRGLAAELGVSPMPVREAVSRLAAEGGLELNQRRISVPAMSDERLLDLIELRLAVEPKLAARAMKTLGRAELQELSRLNAATDQAIESGDVEGYILSNFKFHRAIYGRSGSEVLIPLLDRVWLQMGPFSRIAYGRLGTTQLDDKHLQAIEAVKNRSEAALAEALAADIADGRELLMKQPLPAQSAAE